MTWRALKRFVLPTGVQAELARALDAIWEWSHQVERWPWRDGVAVTVDFAGSATATVQHKLGRTPRGFVVINASGNQAAVVKTDADARTITLAGTAGLEVELWVF